MTTPTNHPRSPMARADAAGIAAAARTIAAGGLVAVPTETVYGLAADARNDAAVARIFAAKGRPRFNPLIVHVADVHAAERIATLDPVALLLAERFWPGPLTMVLPRRPEAALADGVTAGLATVALRAPAHPVMQALLRAAAAPIAAPSANASGRISPTTAAHVQDSLGDAVGLVLDGGACPGGIESTIVVPAADALTVLRPGPITRDMLAAATGLPVDFAGATETVRAPGQLASHYAPTKPVRLNAVQRQGDEYLIGFGAVAGDTSLSPTGDLGEAAAALYAALHRADASACGQIAVAPIPDTGLGRAINDRLRRAATR